MVKIIPLPFEHLNKVRAINSSAFPRYHTRGSFNGDSSDYNLLCSHFQLKVYNKRKSIRVIYKHIFSIVFFTKY